MPDTTEFTGTQESKVLLIFLFTLELVNLFAISNAVLVAVCN